MSADAKQVPLVVSETRCDLLFQLVDYTWQNPNRIPAAQGPIVTLPAVRRRTP